MVELPTTASHSAIHIADCNEWMRGYDGEPFDAIVTDPQYGLAFMGKAFDTFADNRAYRRWSREWAEAALGVVKPGAHLAAFGSTRLHGHQMVALEDAGWEVRDCLMWMYGTGFPKSRNLKGDKGARGAVANNCRCPEPEPEVFTRGKMMRCANCKRHYASPTNGYGTALKPAWEPIILCRAPLAGTVQANFDEHGTGALHIDAGRIPIENAALLSRPNDGTPKTFGDPERKSTAPTEDWESDPNGRWPANVALDEDAAALLDAEFESLPTGATTGESHGVGGATYNLSLLTPEMHALSAHRQKSEGRATNPSRFFYTSKASRAEREAGLHDARTKFDARRKFDARDRGATRANHHPTVKPIDLMRWLCRLVVPKGGRVIDPFAGTGTTLIAAGLEGITGVGVEMDEDYAEIAKTRIRHHVGGRLPL